ncbi:MAG: OmpH family outer membrane protein [Bryobacterales bacterium]
MTRIALLRATVCALAISCVPLMAQTKVAIISIQDVITRTQEGQQLIKQLQDKYAPKSKELEGMNNEINELRNQLNKGQNTMSDDARRDLMRRIQQKERDQQRAVEDARGQFNQEQQQIFNEVGAKVFAVVSQYSQEKGYSIVLDVSSPQTPVFWAANEVNITNDIITAYDAQGGAAAAPSGDAASKPAQ